MVELFSESGGVGGNRRSVSGSSVPGFFVSCEVYGGDLTGSEDMIANSVTKEVLAVCLGTLIRA